jgi:hypothetical protein
MTQEQRIEELERQIRRFRRTDMVALATALVAVVVGVGLLAVSRAGAQPGAPKPNYNTPPWHETNPPPKAGVVIGGEFRLVDDSGATRAVLYLEKGNPVLSFLDQQGIFHASVGLQEDGPHLLFTYGNNRPGMSIQVSDRGAAMACSDSAGHLRIMMSVGSTGAPMITFRDSTERSGAGHVIWTAP